MGRRGAKEKHNCVLFEMESKTKKKYDGKVCSDGFRSSKLEHTPSPTIFINLQPKKKNYNMVNNKLLLILLRTPWYLTSVV